MRLHRTSLAALFGAPLLGCQGLVSLGSPGAAPLEAGNDAANPPIETLADSGQPSAHDAGCAACVVPADASLASAEDASNSPAIPPPPTLGAPGNGDSGATGWLAFDSNRTTPRGILFIRADGSGQTSLWTSGAEEIEPAFSPDGTRIAYTSYANGTPQIVVRVFASGIATRITSLPSGAHAPAWSPDGSLIAFIATPPARADDANVDVPPAGSADIYVVAPDGSGLRDVVSSVDGDSGDSYPDYYPSKVGFAPGATPLVFARLYEIDTVALDGSGYREIVGNYDERTETPSVSPDGARVAFANWDTTAEGIRTISFSAHSTDPAKDGLSTPLLTGTSMNRVRNPAWGPSGFIAVEELNVVTNMSSLTIIGEDGGVSEPPFPLTAPFDDDRDPAWAPTGFAPPNVP